MDYQDDSQVQHAQTSVSKVVLNLFANTASMMGSGCVSIGTLYLIRQCSSWAIGGIESIPVIVSGGISSVFGTAKDSTLREFKSLLYFAAIIGSGMFIRKAGSVLSNDRLLKFVDRLSGGS
jgi:hypothetical protein